MKILYSEIGYISLKRAVIFLRSSSFLELLQLFELGCIIISMNCIYVGERKYVRLAECGDGIVQLNSATLFEFFLLLLRLRGNAQKAENNDDGYEKMGFHRLGKN